MFKPASATVSEIQGIVAVALLRSDKRTGASDVAKAPSIHEAEEGELALAVVHGAMVVRVRTGRKFSTATLAPITGGLKSGKLSYCQSKRRGSTLTRTAYILVPIIATIFVASGRAQSQLHYNFINDYGTGSVQTFVAEANASVAGVQLVLGGHGTANDVTIHVRDLLPDGSLATDILAIGVLDASLVPPDAPAWRTILYEDSFQFVSGESYGLVLNQFGSGPTGFVDYGASTLAPYANGALMAEVFVGEPLWPSNPAADLAFNFVVPEPACLSLLSLAISFGIMRMRMTP